MGDNILWRRFLRRLNGGGGPRGDEGDLRCRHVRDHGQHDLCRGRGWV